MIHGIRLQVVLCHYYLVWLPYVVAMTKPWDGPVLPGCKNMTCAVSTLLSLVATPWVWWLVISTVWRVVGAASQYQWLTARI